MHGHKNVKKAVQHLVPLNLRDNSLMHKEGQTGILHNR